MTTRRIAILFPLAPAAQADFGEPDPVQLIRGNLGSEDPANASQKVVPIVTPTG